MRNILIVYYSRRGENYWNGSIRKLGHGNTEIAAHMIADLTGGDCFEVETPAPYSESYSSCVKEAVDELKHNARPGLKGYPESVDNYDTIFVGYPNWCGTMPMAMFTFLEHFDLTGKRILPFCTNEGSGMGHSEQDLNQVCTGATVEPGLSIRGCQAAGSRDQVADWVKHLL